MLRSVLSSLTPLASLLMAGLLAGVGLQDAGAQTPLQDTRASVDYQVTERVQPQFQTTAPEVGVVVGLGAAIYQGDFSRNPNHNIIKYLGAAKPSVRMGVDYRFGEYQQFGAGGDLSYSYMSGTTQGESGFSNNMINIDGFVDYEIPYIHEGFVRAFIGGGPALLISPSYSNFPADAEQDPTWRPDLGTRLITSLKIGLTFVDRVEIGTRITSTDYLDGYEGFEESDRGFPDIVSFLNFTYRFDPDELYEAWPQ